VTVKEKNGEKGTPVDGVALRKFEAFSGGIIRYFNWLAVNSLHGFMGYPVPVDAQTDGLQRTVSNDLMSRIRTSGGTAAPWTPRPPTTVARLLAIATARPQAP